MVLMSLRAISRGTAIEQPAWLTEFIAKGKRACDAPLRDVVSTARS